MGPKHGTQRRCGGQNGTVQTVRTVEQRCQRGARNRQRGVVEIRVEGLKRLGQVGDLNITWAHRVLHLAIGAVADARAVNQNQIVVETFFGDQTAGAAEMLRVGLGVHQQHLAEIHRTGFGRQIQARLAVGRSNTPRSTAKTAADVASRLRTLPVPARE